MIPELRDLSYEERLKECGLTTLETRSRRLRGDQIEVFQILNGYENIDRNMFFSLKKDSRTRGHEVKLVKDQCRLDIRKHSFSQRTINEWNKLSTDCVTNHVDLGPRRSRPVDLGPRRSRPTCLVVNRELGSMCKEICIYIYIYIYICKEIKCYTVHGCFVYQFYYHVDLGPPILNEVKFRGGDVNFPE